MRRLLIVMMALAGLLAGLLPAAHAAPARTPAIRNGVPVPAYSFQDAVRETVYVEAPADSDRDGRCDRVAVFKPGHRIGLLITATDHDYTLRHPAGTKVSVSPAGSSLRLPLTGEGTG